ncbi:helix-turn-helix domain-containing protein [Paraburkholderia aspalathi]|uniref:helix-turn-helix domain-containing protein n=1 Tax=Paraburkholderia aspalathi TaxID=1324617 RepID=UPI00190BB292|nr:XRE family transcriptional regulator [Paraburkholderia aspalathi]MBK3844385.1 XRE family transcriptional regulator [Paraburkholderia aspalathi]
MPETFGARLIAERERMGLAQGDMKAIAGVSRRTQFNYEQSVRLPDVSYLAALATHGFDIGYLVTGKRSPHGGVVNEALLRNVFVVVESALSNASHSIDVEKKSKLVALVYQTSAENGQVDPLVVQKAVDLIS